MIDMESKLSVAKQLIKHAISCPPARVGLRLKAEGELAKILGLGRRAVNESLTSLALDGVLGRRRGSGTFVRKVVPRNMGLQKLWGSYVSCDTSEIFATPLSAVSRAKKLGCGKQVLHIGLWGDWMNPSLTQQARIAGMVQTIDIEGHYMTLHSMISSPHVPLGLSELRDKVFDSNCDGYIVVARWADLFLEVVGKRHVSVVFCGSQCGHAQQPSVTHACVSIFTKAVEILKSGGYRKISIVGLADASVPQPLLTLAYRRAMEDHGLDYDRSLFWEHGQKNIIAQFVDLLNAAERPDALYLPDDTILPSLIAALEITGLRPGRDIGLICLTNEHNKASCPTSWSQMIFNQEMIGKMASKLLLNIMADSSHIAPNLRIFPTWVPGETHIRSE